MKNTKRIKVFVSRQNEGWTEVCIPKNFSDNSYEYIVKHIGCIVTETPYKGLLITENPDPFI